MADDGDIQEVRFAAAMSGGVSLAVWMGGLTSELDRLVRVSQQLETTAVDAIADPIDKLYATLISALQVRCVVDVLSGTSAGGINAAALALAWSAGSTVMPLRDLWFDEVSIAKLLRDPGTPPWPSLLQGDGVLYEGLKTGLHQINAQGDPGSRAPASRRPLRDDHTAPRRADEHPPMTFGTAIQAADHHGHFQFRFANGVPDAKVLELALAAGRARRSRWRSRRASCRSGRRTRRRPPRHERGGQRERERVHGRRWRAREPARRPCAACDLRAPRGSPGSESPRLRRARPGRQVAGIALRARRRRGARLAPDLGREHDRGRGGRARPLDRHRSPGLHRGQPAGARRGGRVARTLMQCLPGDANTIREAYGRYRTQRLIGETDRVISAATRELQSLRARAIVGWDCPSADQIGTLREKVFGILEDGVPATWNGAAPTDDELVGLGWRTFEKAFSITLDLIRRAKKVAVEKHMTALAGAAQSGGERRGQRARRTCLAVWPDTLDDLAVLTGRAPRGRAECRSRRLRRLGRGPRDGLEPCAPRRPTVALERSRAIARGVDAADERGGRGGRGRERSRSQRGVRGRGAPGAGGHARGPGAAPFPARLVLVDVLETLLTPDADVWEQEVELVQMSVRDGFGGRARVHRAGRQAHRSPGSPLRCVLEALVACQRLDVGAARRRRLARSRAPAARAPEMAGAERRAVRWTT